jgi:hypothetical protein
MRKLIWLFLLTPCFGQINNPNSATGTVTTTGSPASGQLTAFSGATSITTASAHNLSLPLLCQAASASGTAYTCSTSPTFVPADGDVILFEADVASGVTPTLVVNAQAGTPALNKNLNGALVAIVTNDLVAGGDYLAEFDGTNWQVQGNLGTALYQASGAGQFPTLNQNTSGSAASLSISGQTGLITLTGITSTNRAKTVRDAADTILELGGSYTPTGTWTSLTLVTPALGTPASGTLTNATGLPVAGLSNLGASVGTFLTTPTITNLASAVTAANAAGTLQLPSTTTNNGTTSGTQAVGCVPTNTCGSWGSTAVTAAFGVVKSGTAGTTAGFADLGAGVTTAAMSQQTTATCTNVTNMTWNIAANKNYLLSCEVPITLAASATIQFCLGGPGTATSYSLEDDGPLGAAAAYAQFSTLAQTAYGTKTGASSAVGAAEWVHVKATVRNGATASGTALTLQTAANGTNGITVGQDASCQLTQVN